MGIKNRKRASHVSKSAIKTREACSAHALTVVFSFHHLSKDPKYNFRYFDKMKKNTETTNAIVSFVDKIAEFSKLTWEQLQNMPRKSGYEHLPVDQLEKSFINSLDIPLTNDDICFFLLLKSRKRTVQRRPFFMPFIALRPKQTRTASRSFALRGFANASLPPVTKSLRYPK